MPNKTTKLRFTEAIKVITKEALEEQFITLNKNKKDVEDYFNIGEKVLYKLLNMYNIRKSPQQIIECRNKTKVKIAGTLEDYYKLQTKKFKETMMKRYGVESAMQVKEFFEKGVQTKIAKYGNPYYCDFEKLKHTNRIKYGKDFYVQTNEFKSKFKNTSVEKYGVEHPSKNPDILEKCWKTKLSNNKTNYSKLEEYCYNELIDVFGVEDIVRQYIEKRYPFHCDFYVKSLDLFIEINGTWLHNSHPFNQFDENDVRTLELIRSKQRIVNGKKNQYFKAESVWTIEDPHKLEVAHNNNLNYVVIYTIDEIKSFIEKFRKHPLGNPERYIINGENEEEQK